jgi:predicted nuclease of predicted toxin-antitoxin system
MRLLANENFPRLVVDALRAAGHDVTWVRTDAPGSTDPDVLARAVADGRLLLTFDKDFGELAFRLGLPATPGVVLFRSSLADPTAAADFIVRTLAARTDWPGHFSVVDDQRIRMRPLSGGGQP